MPRRFSIDAVLFWPRFAGAVLQVMGVIRSQKTDVVAGFGGYASAPAYVASWLTKTPLVIHEANQVAGFANRLGALFTSYVVTTFSQTRLPHSRLLGMPMARSITHPDTRVSVAQARKHFGLDPKKKTLLVTGGSQGSVRLNQTTESMAEEILGLGWQIIHLVGRKNSLPTNLPAGYVAMHYCDRMDMAFRAATAVISRAGAATVSEIQIVGLPAIFVPYPVGNGEQEKNAADSLNAGAAVMVLDHDFTPEYVRDTVLPLLADHAELERMRAHSEGLGRPDAASLFVEVMSEALSGRTRRK
jgi:UDP-N-acetylglucosamine--N-acetylmuramyl-(pentapeptide) pyrophosphoryl-undecaprenol N-acetylglucosamine transferase